MLRYLLVFVPLFVAMAANNDNNMLTQLGLGDGAVLAAAVAAFLALLIFEYKTIFLVLTVLVAVAANLPPEAAIDFGFERDYALAALLSILLSPRIVDQLDA